MAFLCTKCVERLRSRRQTRRASADTAETQSNTTKTAAKSNTSKPETNNTDVDDGDGDDDDDDDLPSSKATVSGGIAAPPTTSPGAAKKKARICQRCRDRAATLKVQIGGGRMATLCAPCLEDIKQRKALASPPTSPRAGAPAALTRAKSAQPPRAATMALKTAESERPGAPKRSMSIAMSTTSARCQRCDEASVEQEIAGVGSFCASCARKVVAMTVK